MSGRALESSLQHRATAQFAGLQTTGTRGCSHGQSQQSDYHLRSGTIPGGQVKPFPFEKSRKLISVTGCELRQQEIATETVNQIPFDVAIDCSGSVLEVRPSGDVVLEERSQIKTRSSLFVVLLTRVRQPGIHQFPVQTVI